MFIHFSRLEKIEELVSPYTVKCLFYVYEADVRFSLFGCLYLCD